MVPAALPLAPRGTSAVLEPTKSNLHEYIYTRTQDKIPTERGVMPAQAVWSI